MRYSLLLRRRGDAEPRAGWRRRWVAALALASVVSLLVPRVARLAPLAQTASSEAARWRIGANRRRRLDATPKAQAKKARVAYLIMAGGSSEVDKLKRMLPVMYSEDNYYLVHLDRKTPVVAREDARAFLGSYKKGNAMLLEPALTVSWGGFSITLAAIFGLSSAVQWFPDWDYFINLSASDFPLLTQDEIGRVLGTVKDDRVSFMKGAPLEKRFIRRITRYIDDQGLYRDKFTRQPMNPLRTGVDRRGVEVPRPQPTLFQVFKGEFWVVLHRSFCEYVAEAPDNTARLLMTYFSKFRISDESYFQTVACHPNAPDDFRFCGDYLRQINWPQFQPGQRYRLHPTAIGVEQVPEFMSSGALFARKFDNEVRTSAAAMDKIESLLKDSSRSGERVKRALARIGSIGSLRDRSGFCNATGEWERPQQM